MDFFKRAKVFRLKSGHHAKYLVADQDDETVRQSSNAASPNAHWAVEPVEGKTNIVRFRNCHTSKYLATTDETFLSGMTGKRLAQRLRLDSTVEWEPVKEGQYLKIKSHVGTLLKANPLIPPWRNSVTHDVPGHWSGSENSVLWIVDIVEIDYGSSRGSKSGYEPPEVVKHAVDDAPASSSNAAHQKVQSGYSPSASMNGNVDGSYRHKKSDSKSKPKPGESVLNEKLSTSGKLSRLPSAESMAGLAINVAKITFKELHNLEFHIVLSSGQVKKLEKAVSVISSNAKASRRPNKQLANLEEQLKNLIKDHKRASQELEDYTTFSSRRYETRSEVKKDVAKVRKLEAVENELKNGLIAEKARREELLKQLQEIDDSIKSAEKSHADSQVEFEELISRIQRKSAAYKVMEREQKSWQVRKKEAEQTLVQVEDDWFNVKSIISDYW